MPRFARRPPRTERTPAGIRTRISGKPHTVGMCRSARKTTASRARAAYAIPPPRFAPPRAAVLRVSVRSFAANPQRSFSDIAPTLLALRAKTDRYLPLPILRLRYSHSAQKRIAIFRFRYCAYAARTPRKNGSLSSALSIGFAPLRNSCGTNRRVLRICRRRREFPHEHARRAPVFRLYFTIYGGKSKPLFPKRQTFKQILICAASAAPDARQRAKDRSSLFPAARPLPADTLTKRHIGRAARRYCVRRTGKAPYKARLSESVR